MRTFLRYALTATAASLTALATTRVVQAQVRTSGFEDITLGANDPITIILNILAWALGILSLIAVVLVLYGGFLWLTSAGNEEKVQKAKDVLKNAIIGLLIIMSAWGIVLYIINIFSDATGTNVNGSGNGSGRNCIGCTVPGGGSSFYVLSTNPEASETGVYLCTDVTVRMSDDVDQASINSETFFVQVADGGAAGSTCSVNTECSSGVCQDSVCQGDTLPGDIGFGPGATSSYFNFIPENTFEQDTIYEATVLAGSSGVLSLDPTADGIDDRLALSTTYTFQFTTGSDTDTTPPTVQRTSSSPFPVDGETNVCLNTVVSFDFSEPIRISTVNDDTSFMVDYAGTSASPETPDWANAVSLRDWSFGAAFDYAQARPESPLAASSLYSARLFAGDALNDFAGAITDTCGNPLDGDEDGVSEGSTIDNVEGYDAAAGESESPLTWETGQNAECTPIIDSFAPAADYYGEYAGLRAGDTCTSNAECGSGSCVSGVCEGYGDTTLTITGTYLAPHPEVIFGESGVIASDDLKTCFNEEHLGNVSTHSGVGDSCLDDELQTTTSLVLRTPVGASSNSSIAVEIAGERSETVSSLQVLSPYISGVSPDNGAIGQYITIAGANFDEDQGSGFARMVSADGGRTSTLTLPESCGDSWDADSIIAVAPSTYTNTDGSTGTWQSGDIAYVQVINDSGRYSNLVLFTFNTTSRPNLCSVVASCNDTANANFVLNGNNFGSNQGSDTVAFASGGDFGYNASISSWSDTTIGGATSSGMTQDAYWVSVYDADTGQNSNVVQYEIPCTSAPQVVDISTCAETEDIYPVPSPRPNSTDACINASVGVLFDQPMNSSTLNTGNIYLRQYNSGDALDASYQPLSVTAHMQTNDWSYEYNGAQYNGFQLNVDRSPIDSDQNGEADSVGTSSNLQPNTWYELTITTGVQSSDGVSLPETYTMRFKTRNSSELCSVSSVDLEPNDSIQNSYWDSALGDRTSELFIASPYDTTCILLDADSYNWDWSIDNTDIGDFGLRESDTASQSVYVAGSDTQNEGETNVTASTSGVADTATFAVDLGYCETDSDCSATCEGSVCNEATNECSPVVESISPTNGDHGTWVTIDGCMLGGDRGTVQLFSSDGTVTAEAEWPDESVCGNTWTNESIVIEVPDQYDSDADGSVDADLPETTYALGITLPSGLSSEQSTNLFTLNSTLRPGLCLISPDSASLNDGVTAYGTGFGATPGYATFRGADDYSGDGIADRVTPLPIDTVWSDTEIDTVVPHGAITGTIADSSEGFRATVFGGDPQCIDDSLCSNPLDFHVTCESSLDCASGVCSDSGFCIDVPEGTQCTQDSDCQVNGCSESTCSDAGYCTPVITQLEESSGPNGGYTTIQGCYFGSYGENSAVRFLNESDDLSTGSFPCTDSWSDTQIVTTIPASNVIPPGTEAEVSVMTSSSAVSNTQFFQVTNTCSNGAAVPSGGVPLLCALLPSSGSEGDSITFNGYAQQSGQSNYFYNSALGDNLTIIDDSSSAAQVPAGAESGDAYISAFSCVSNGLQFGLTCDTAADCGEGYCVEGICTSESASTCGSCTVGTSDTVCGEQRGCYLDAGEGAYCCGSRPTITSVSVDNGDANVCPNSMFVVEFSEGMTNTSAISLTEVTLNSDGTYSTVASVPTTIQANADGTVFDITPSQLNVSTTYLLTLTSETDASSTSLNGLSTGLALVEGTQTYVFTTAANTCQPAYIEMLNDETGDTSYTFSAPNSSTDFTAYMHASDGQYLSPTDDVNWEYSWSPYFDENYCNNVAWVDLTSEDDNSGEAAATSETQTIQSGEEHNQVESITVTASPLSGWTGSLDDTSTVSTFYCNQGEAWEYIDESGSGSFISHVYPQHFRLIYCDTAELPTLNASVQTGGANDDWFLQYLFVSPEDNNDVFGIRVYENSEHLSPSAWYAAHVPNPGSPAETEVDGYKAIQDGLSYYVAASNIDTDANGDGLDELYGNMYLITFNDSAAMSAIGSQIMEYIRFNWNVSYAECEGSDKDKIVRDTERVTELGEVASLANTYYADHNGYPYPQSESFGSYIEEITNSVWSSWQGALGNVLGQTLPEDPYNFFYASDNDDPWNAGQTPWVYTGENATVQDCEYDGDHNEFFDEAGNCWDPINAQFYCPENSHTYLWKVDPLDTDNAYLYANMEYTSSSTETYINSSTTQEPCGDVDSDSSCSCYNYVISSENDPGGTWE